MMMPSIVSGANGNCENDMTAITYVLIHITTIKEMIKLIKEKGNCVFLWF